MIKEKMKQLIGKSINKYNAQHVKDVVSELKFKEQYQGRIIDCMVGEVDDNYIETPETDSSIVKLEHSKEGLIKVHSIKGKTILVDADGNETDTPGEGCRLVSVGEDRDKIIILSKNKNLFNGEIERYFINSSTGQNNGWMEYWRSKDYIRCTPNEKYLVNFKYKDIKKNGAMFFYDKDKNYIGMTYTNPTVTPSNCEFIRIAGQAENSGTLIDITKVTDIMLCKGVDVADYIEPKQHKTEISLKEPLRSLPNGVYDEIIDNKLIRRIGYFILDEKVFNIGSESAGWKPQIQTIPFYKYCNQFKPELKVKTNSLCFSNRLSINKSFVASDIEGLGFSSGNPYASYFGGRLKRDKIENQDGYSVANYINNTQILYELAEPIIEELPNSITIQGFDDTTMYIENSITPTVTYGYNALIPYKEEVLNQQQEVETNTLDIEQNIIPYLMDMEFNLMLMEDE